ncbi:hypothetical protein EON68_00235 [archaeon]|nr:MAG: hypothetical protein EON68_00235 [archaeon]
MQAPSVGLNRRLLAASRRGDVGFMRRLMHDGAAPTATDAKGNTPLHCAAARNHAAAVQCLLQEGGAAARVANALGECALHSAVWAGASDDIVALLIAADPAACHDATAAGNTPLHLAALGGRARLASLLLTRDSAVRDTLRATASDGDTPLHWAAYRGDVRIVRALIDAGADVLARNKAGYTPLHWVAAHAGGGRSSSSGASAGGSDGDDTASIISLLAGAARGVLEATDVAGWTPLQLAAWCHRLPAVVALVQAGANVHAATARGKTALHLAAQRGDARVVTALLTAGACVDVLEDTGNTALHLAAADGHVACITALAGVASSSALQLKNKAGDTPLYIATREGEVAAVAYMLTLPSAPVNVQNHSGWTCLHRAAYFGQPDLVRTLLCAGGDVTLKSTAPHKRLPAGSTAVDAARTGGHASVIACLVPAHTRASASDAVAPPAAL